MRCWRYSWRERVERFQLWASWRMPRWLEYWCAIRLMAHATTGEYGSTVVPELSGMDALRRWERA